jgi:hypothetical protein
MFAMLQNMYKNGTITIEKLKSAVVKSWITADQFKQICGQDYTT